MDFKNISIMQQVAEGDELAHLLPPGQGKPGRNVHGQEVPFEPGQPAIMPIGPNTAAKQDDPNVLIAKSSGAVLYKGNVVEVVEGYSVPGNVDFSTGNIKYSKSVSINGDVKSGFAVETGGDLEIGGTVEDATMKCEGNVLIKGGFVGSGKGRIESKGSVSLGFCRYQEVRAMRDIVIAKEALNATLYANGCIELLGAPYSVAGGRTVAFKEIKARVIGNPNETKTEIEVGSDFVALEEQKKTKEKLKEILDSHKRLALNIQKLRQARDQEILSQTQKHLLKKLETTEQSLVTQITALQKRQEIICKKLEMVGKPRILVEESLYPGTIVKIGDRSLTVREKILGPKTILVSNEQIKIV